MDKTDDQTTGNDVKGHTPKASTPDVGRSYEKELVYAPDGKFWREKYTGLEGHFRQRLDEEVKNALKEQEGTYEEKLQTEIKTREERVAEMQNKLQEVGSQLGELKTLQERLPELEKEARQAAKLRAMLEYPDLVNQQVEEVVQGEDGEERKLVTNPILDLIQSVDLEGDELRERLKQLNKIVKKEVQLDPSPLEGASPAPGEPIEETPEYWEQKAREARNESIMAPTEQERNAALDKMLEYSSKKREAEVALQS